MLNALNRATNPESKSTEEKHSMYIKMPHIRTYSYGISLIRFLLATHNIAICCIKEMK